MTRRNAPKAPGIDLRGRWHRFPAMRDRLRMITARGRAKYLLHRLPANCKNTLDPLA